MPVGGSRHYQGAGLGQVGLWGCPSCGEDNTGPLEQGCVHCGAGKPAAKAPETPTPSTPPAPTPAAEYRSGEIETEMLRLWRAWEQQYPDATNEMAYIAGYVAGWNARRAQQAQPTQPAVAGGDAKTYRTVAAALALFRDQVLVERPEEVETGEWLSADEATTVIDQLQQLLGREAVHA